MKLFPLFKVLLRLLPFALFGVALLIVHHELQAYEFSDLYTSWKTISFPVIASAIGLATASYGVLAMGDLLALKYTGHDKIPLKDVLFASFISYSLSNNTGYALAAGGSVRYRLYERFKVSGWDVAQISIFLSITYLLGIVTMGLVGGVLLPPHISDNLTNHFIINVMIGLCAAILVAYWALIMLWRKPLVIKNKLIRLPTSGMTLAQTLLSCLDLLVASMVLWVFLSGSGISFQTFIVLYIVAQMIGLMSQVPGGIGVFESTFLWLTGFAYASDQSAILTALVFYRIIYYFVPLAVAGLLLVVQDLYGRRQHIARIGQTVSRFTPSSVPQIFSILLFLTGGFLLVSGATPQLPENINWLRNFVPLPLIEFSHLTGSFIGILLLFLARGIRLKLDAAWYGALILLAGGIITSLLKGAQGVEICILGFMLFTILISRRHFYRKSSLFQVSFNASWFLMIFAMIAISSWVGFFSYRSVDYSHDLWWQFSYFGDASRFLRSLVVMAGVTLIVLARYFFKIHRPATIQKASLSDLDRAMPLIKNENDTQAFLSLLGDKSFFWSEDGTAFVAYAVTTRYWIVMGNPIGDKKAFDDLLWRFREEADNYGAHIVFYQVSEDFLPYYLNLGLVFLKLGQEARILLPAFSLKGKKRDNLRHGYNKIAKLHYVFKVIDPVEIAANMPRIREISDLWLAQKKVREKGFSLGFFNEAYLLRTPMAVVLDENARIVAFANLWKTDNRQELSVDLMRYDPAAPRGVMDFLFADLMLWGREQGYEWFNLGVAPLSGLGRHRLAPFWHKIGTVIYDLGDKFYNFEGLYDYKAKFEPQWQSRYLATPAGLSAPLVFWTVTRLISGGLKGLVAK